MKSNIEILRNYVDGVRPVSVFGYTGKKYIKHEVGSTWVDPKGIEWEQKECGPVRVNRVANVIREAVGIEKCDKCQAEMRWGSRTDNILYRKTGLCTNCLIDYETKLRIVGIYDDYEICKMVSNEMGFLKDAKDKIQDTIKFFSSDSGDITMVCNSDGFMERWKNTNKDKILEDAKKDLKLVYKKIKVLSKIKSKHNKKFKEGAKKYNLESYV
jgi:hypothetical protein